VLRTAPAVAAPAVRQRWPWRRRSGGWASLALRPAAPGRNSGFAGVLHLRSGPADAARLCRRACRSAPAAHPPFRRRLRRFEGV